MQIEDALRICAAILAGAVIGCEREIRDKPAGLRTNVLICFGAALFTLLSERIAASAGGDPARIAAQVVTGIGFLGAGAIIHHRMNVVGLTTAATIWTVASIGMAFGAGHFVTGAIATLLALVVLQLLVHAEALIGRMRSTALLRIRLRGDLGHAQALREALERGRLRCQSWHVSKSRGGLLVTARLVGTEDAISEIECELFSREDVESFHRL